MGSRVNPPTRWVNPRNLAGWWVGGLTGWRVRKPQPNPRNLRVVSCRVGGSCRKLPPLFIIAFKNQWYKFVKIVANQSN